MSGKFKLRVDLGKRPPKRIVYLYHLDPPYKHAKHYLGKTDDFNRRDAEHGGPHGARLLQVQKEAGGSWHLVRTWRGGGRKERALKTVSGAQYCPECTPNPRSGNQRGGMYRTRRERTLAQVTREANGQKIFPPIARARELTPEEIADTMNPPEIPIASEVLQEMAVRRLERQWVKDGGDMAAKDRRAGAETAEEMIQRMADAGMAPDQLDQAQDDICAELLSEASGSNGQDYALAYETTARILQQDFRAVHEAQEQEQRQPA